MSKYIVNQKFINCINFLIESKKVPSKSFLAKTFNISNPKFSEILNNRMNVGVDILMILVSEFNISSEWLLTGQGEMLKNAPTSEPAPQESHAGSDRYTALLEDKIALLEKNNASLEYTISIQEKITTSQEREIQRQQEKITSKDQEIQRLKEKITQLKKEAKSHVFSPAPVG